MTDLAPVELSKKLNNLERRFVTAMLHNANPAVAAESIGITADEGRAMMKKHRVRAGLNALRSNAVKSMGVDAGWIMYRLYQSLTADVADLFNSTGAIRPAEEWPEIWRQGLVSGLEVKEIRGDEGKFIGYLKKVKFADRTEMLEMLGRHVNVKAFEKEIDAGALFEIAARINDAVARFKTIDGDYEVKPSP